MSNRATEPLTPPHDGANVQPVKLVAGLGLVPGLGVILWLLVLATRSPVPPVCSPPIVHDGQALPSCATPLQLSSPVVAVLLGVLLVVVGIACVALWTRETWQPLFLVDVVGIASAALIEAGLLTLNDHKHALTRAAIVMLPIAIAGLAVSAAAAWTVGRRRRAATSGPGPPGLGLAPGPGSHEDCAA